VADKPILFSGSMIRALLSGSKTQTRRVLKIRGHRSFSEFGPSDTRGYDWHFRDDAMRWHDLRNRELVKRLSYATSDRLWVREASADVHPLAVQEGRYSIAGQAGIPGPPPVKYRRVYRADGDVLQVWHTSKGYPYRALDPEDDIAQQHPVVCSEWVGRLKYQPWESPIHMPRWASRLTLIVTDVRVQRLQDISEEDCIAEGPPDVNNDPRTISGELQPMVVLSPGRMMTPRAWYHTLWDQINGPDAWDENPWVAAYTFTVHRKNIDQMEAEHAD